MVRFVFDSPNYGSRLTDVRWTLHIILLIVFPLQCLFVCSVDTKGHLHVYTLTLLGYNKKKGTRFNTTINSFRTVQDPSVHYYCRYWCCLLVHINERPSISVRSSWSGYLVLMWTYYLVPSSSCGK